MVPLPYLFLIKFLLALEWVTHLFFDRLLDQGTHHHHHHPLPLKKALKAILIISEDHTYQGLILHFLVPSLLYYLRFQLDLLFLDF